jgi:hypothetical protein
LSKAEKKAIKNFRQYLRGQGDRCPDCLHKAAKHSDLKIEACLAEGCECPFDRDEVLEIRSHIKAPGWERG